MKHLKFAGVVFLGAALVAGGCAKKSTTDASIANTGFDSASSTPTADELSQLPQAVGTNLASVDALPIEAAPVTQAVSSAVLDGSGFSHEQQIQTALKTAGLYSGKIDGKIGPGTKKAIMAFQGQSGLKADGKVGPKTWAALEKYLTGASTETETDSSQAVQ